MLRFIFALLLPVVASAQPVGPSLLGMCSKNFACKRSLSVFEGQEVAATGWLVATFGDDAHAQSSFYLYLARSSQGFTLQIAPASLNAVGRCGKNEPFHGETITVGR